MFDSNLLFGQQPPQELTGGQIVMGAIAIFVILAMLIAFFVFMSYFRWWIQSFFTGAGIGLLDLLGMTFRKVRISDIVTTKIMAVQAGLNDDTDLTTKALEAHYLAGGNVPQHLYRTCY